MRWIGLRWEHNMKTYKELNDAHDILHKAGWRYIGGDDWRDYITDMKLVTSIAYKVEMQRDGNQKLFRRLQNAGKPRLIHRKDWMGIAQELRKQLKSFGLTVKTCGVSQNNGDF